MPPHPDTMNAAATGETAPSCGSGIPAEWLKTSCPAVPAKEALMRGILITEYFFRSGTVE